MEKTAMKEIPKAKYSIFGEKIRNVIPSTVQCSVGCGGRNCKWENPSKWSGQDQAIRGLYSSWVLPDVLAMSRPSTEAIQKYDIIKQFKENDICSVINLQRPGEHASCGPLLHRGSQFTYEPQEFMDDDIFFYNFGWKDYGVMSLNTVLDMVKVMTFAISEGKVAVHCHAGLGRTGVLIACYMVYTRRMDAALAIEAVRRKRPNSIQTRSQLACVQEFATFLKPLRIVFPQVVPCGGHLTLAQCLRRQSRLLHGLKSRQLRYIPKVVYIVCRRLAEIATKSRGFRSADAKMQSKSGSKTRKSEKERSLRRRNTVETMKENIPGAFVNEYLYSKHVGDGLVDPLEADAGLPRNVPWSANPKGDSRLKSDDSGTTDLFGSSTEEKGSAEPVGSHVDAPAKPSVLGDSKKTFSLGIESVQEITDLDEFLGSVEKRKEGDPADNVILNSSIKTASKRPKSALILKKTGEDDFDFAGLPQLGRWSFSRSLCDLRKVCPLSSGGPAARKAETSSGDFLSPRQTNSKCSSSNDVRRLTGSGSKRGRIEDSVTVAMALADKLYGDECLKEKVCSRQVELNMKEEAWSSLCEETDAHLLSCLMWSWIEGLAEPILTAGDVDTLIEEARLKAAGCSDSEDFENAARVLGKPVSSMLCCVLDCIAQLSLLPVALELSVLKRAVRAFTQTSDRHEDLGSDTQPSNFEQLVFLFQNYLAKKRKRLEEATAEEDIADNAKTLSEPA